MNISTNTIQLTKKEYFRILSSKYFKQRWWFFVLILSIALYALFEDQKEAFDYFIIIAGFTWPLYAVLYFRRFAYSNENKIALLSRYYRFEEDQIIGVLEDGTESPIRLEHIIKIYKTKELAMLYLSKITFIYLPKSAFKEDEDYNQVLAHIGSRVSAKQYGQP